jgi:hypothetical protein
MPPGNAARGFMRPLTGCSKGTPGNSLLQGPSQVAEHLPNDTCKTDPDLAALVAAWPGLPEAIRAGIVAMVKAASGKGGWS